MAPLVRGLTRAALRVPALTIVLVLLLTGVLGVLSGQQELDQGQESFSPDNPALTAANFAQEAFEGSLATIVQVVVEGDDVVSPEGLQTVAAVREAIAREIPAERLSGQNGQPFISYLLPVELSIAQGGLDPTTLTSDEAVDAAYVGAFAQLPAEVVGITEGLVAVDGGAEARADGTTALALVFLDTEAIIEGIEGVDAQTAAQIAAVKDVVEVVADVDAPLATSAFAFELLFEQDDAFTSEVGRLFGTAAVIIVLILLLVYAFPPRGTTTRGAALRRAAADTLLTLFAILASISWMQGIGVLLGPDYLGVIGPFTPPTQIIPILLIGLGVDYAIHVTSRYREEVATGAEVQVAIERAAGTVGVALLLATMTTALGFLTNLANPVPAIQDFGVLAAVGITVAFLLMLTFLPAARLLLDRRAGDTLPRAALGASADGVLSRATAATSVLGERFAVPVVIVTLVLGALGGYGLTQLSTEFSFTDFVPADNPVLETFTTIEEGFGGGFGEQTTIVAQGDPATPAVHNATVGALGGLATVDGVLLVGEQPAAESVVGRIGQQLQLAQLADAAASGGAAPAAPAAGGAPGGPPVDPAAVEAAVGFQQQAFGMGLQPDLTVAADTDVAALYDLLFSVDPTVASVLARGDAGEYRGSLVIAQTQSNTLGALDFATAVEDAFAPVADAIEPADGASEASVVATSTAIITQGIIGDLSSSQISSLVITLLAALVLLVLVFGIRDRRPLLGAVTLFPVGLVLLWVFGMMAATGIPFGPVTSTISGLAIGIGVPFTIHITNRFTEDLTTEATVHDALQSTLRHTGGALAGSALTTMAGFIILVTSTLVPFQQLGLVVAYAIGFSLIAAILVLPSLLVLWARARGITATGGATATDAT